MAEYLFVYGTLKPEHAPPQITGIVHQLQPAGHGVVRGFLYDLGEYPGVRLAADGNEIQGEIFAFDQPAMLPSLDAYEGYEPENPERSLFIRKHCEVRANGTVLLCWVYEYNREPQSSQRIDTWPRKSHA